MEKQRVAVIGAGPAGLAAAETLARAGCVVTVFDHMPSVARKFLIAGRGGLNLTHSESLEEFLAQYRPAAPALLDAVRAFPPAALVSWCEGLGIETFVGSSGRVFPKAMKASPLLRAWLARLGALGVTLRTRHRWIGLDATTPRFATPDGEATHPADAVVLACGGASWPRLGSDGGWVRLLPSIAVTPFAPSNVGFVVDWSERLRAQHAGAALKRIAVSFAGRTVRGEAVLTASGIEGGAIYALSAAIRDAIARDGSATFSLDLRPDIAADEVARRLAVRGRGETASATLRKALALPPVAIALVQEARHQFGARDDLATLVKALPLETRAPQGLARAISSAGGMPWSALDERFMLRAHPGLFACGEMLDWEAPTGGYLLQGCFATGVAAAEGVLAWRGGSSAPPPSHAAKRPDLSSDTKRIMSVRMTAEDRLPGDPTPREVVARTIRVDHAGEYGARRIYEGQLAVLGRTKYGPVLEHMKAQEQVHLDYFSRAIAKRRVRPTALLPLWHVAGFVLGAGTALLGHRGAMACTVAVEEAIDEHYREQTEVLGEDEAELKTSIERFRAEELEHRDIGLDNEAELAPAYKVLSAVIKAGCKVAIKVSERV